MYCNFIENLEISIILFFERTLQLLQFLVFKIIQNEIVISAKMADFYIRLKVLEFFILELLRTYSCFLIILTCTFIETFVKMNIDLY